MTAFGSLRRSGGITGRVLSKATAALLSAGALEGVIGEIGPDILVVQEVGDPEALEALRERLAGD